MDKIIELKNTSTIQNQLTLTNITMCYGKKAYRQFAKKNYDIDIELNSHASCTSIDSVDGDFFAIMIGVNKYDKDIYALKGLIVHEISHAVTKIMDHFGFSCDEYRSYMMQMLYQHFVQWIDDVIYKSKNKNKKNKSI